MLNQLHPEISIEEVEPKRRRWKSAKEKENENKGNKKSKKSSTKSPASKGKKKKNNNIEEENESEGEKSSVLEIESEASDEEDEPQMRNYLLSEIRVPEVRAQFIKRRFTDAILTADDDDDETPARNNLVTPVNDDRVSVICNEIFKSNHCTKTLNPPKINTWAECVKLLVTIPYSNDEEASADLITHLTPAEIDNAKQIYEFIESSAAAGVTQSRLQVSHKILRFDY